MKTFKDFVTEINRHGIPKGASKADLEKIRSSEKSSKGKKQLAHWLLNMHHNESIEYNSSMGGHEWGTPKGTEYMKSVTPGETVAGETKAKYRKDNAKKEPKLGEYGHHHTPGFAPQESDKDEDMDVAYKKETAKKAPKKPEAKITESSYDEYKQDNEDEAIFLTPDDIDFLNSEIESMTPEKLDAYYEWDPEEEDEEDAEEEEDEEDEEDDIEEETQLDEVLSVQGRLKRRFAAKRNKQKLKVARRIAIRRGSTPDRLAKRAKRSARNMIYKRLTRGRDKSTMPPAEKARFEKMIVRYAPLVNRLAVRLKPIQRQKELKRLTHRGQIKPQTSKKYKASKPIAKKQVAKKFKIKRNK